MISSGSLSRGMTRSSERRKSATPTRSTSEWNGTSMPGTKMNDRLPPVISRRRSTSSSSASRPRTVPAIAYCEPRRLKFTICRNSPVRSAISSTNAGDVGVVEVDLRRADRGQPVVGPAQLVARHDVVHLRAALEHHLQQRFQPVHAAHAGQRGVLADGVTAGDRVFDERALLTHLGDLRGGHRRHGDLGELRQVQHALGVLVVHAAGDQAGRVVPHHVQDREAQRLAGELVGVVPHLAGGLRTGADVHAHALVLNALARERVDRLRRGQPRGRRHHQVRADPGGDLQNLCALVDSDAVDAEVHLVAGPHHAQEAGRPADQPGRRAGLAVGGGDDVLRRGRQPHAVHDRRFQAGQQRGGPVGVDRVVVTGHHRERPHVDRRGKRDVAPATPRGIGGVLGHRAAGPHRVGQLGGAGAAADREPLLQGGQHGAGRLSATVTETGTTRPTSVSVATEAVAVTVNSAGALGSAPTR